MLSVVASVNKQMQNAWQGDSRSIENPNQLCMILEEPTEISKSLSISIYIIKIQIITEIKLQNIIL